MNTEITAYEMNPAEDTLLYGDELREGMLVLPEDETTRYQGSSEDARLRSQRFCTVTRLRDLGEHFTFIGVWVDGFQKSWGAVRKANTWIVKRDSTAREE
jgi:hypothetical protein